MEWVRGDSENRYRSKISQSIQPASMASLTSMVTTSVDTIQTDISVMLDGGASSPKKKGPEGDRCHETHQLADRRVE